MSDFGPVGSVISLSQVYRTMVAGVMPLRGADCHWFLFCASCLWIDIDLFGSSLSLFVKGKRSRFLHDDLVVDPLRARHGLRPTSPVCRTLQGKP